MGEKANYDYTRAVYVAQDKYDDTYLFHKEAEAIKDLAAANTGNKGQAVGAQVIGVFGERGSGKTSLLKTIEGLDLSSLEDKSSVEGTDESPKKVTILKLPMIDPTVISDSLSLIEILMGKIWVEFKSEKETSNLTCNNNDNCKDNFRTAEKTEMTTALKDVIRVMAEIKGGAKNFYVDVPSISILEKIEKRERFAELVKNVIDRYIKYLVQKMGENSKATDESFKLMILIDDLDLVSPNMIYAMMEDIRQYLPATVVVVLACRNTQLIQAINQNNLQNNADLLAHRMMDLDEIQNRTTKYINKLIPLSHRVYMPSNRANYSNQANLLLHGILDDAADSTETVESYIVSNIEKQTGFSIAPVSESEKTTRFLPVNLRGLMQLATFLKQMKPGKTTENLGILQEFYDSHSRDTLNEQHFEILKEWRETADSRKNYFIYHKIRNMYYANCAKPSDPEVDKKFDNVNALFTRPTYQFEPYNITLANVVSILEIYKTTFQSEEVNQFVYLTKVFYSIYLGEIVANIKVPSDKIPVDLCWSKYHEIINGKFIPDSFYYLAGADREDALLNFDSTIDENADNMTRPFDLFLKLVYSDIAASSNTRGNRKGEFETANYQKYYIRSANKRDYIGSAYYYDPMVALLKADYLQTASQNNGFILTSLFHIDTILRRSFGRKSDNNGTKFLGKQLREVNDLIAHWQPENKYPVFTQEEYTIAEHLRKKVAITTSKDTPKFYWRGADKQSTIERLTSILNYLQANNYNEDASELERKIKAYAEGQKLTKSVQNGFHSVLAQYEDRIKESSTIKGVK